MATRTASTLMLWLLIGALLVSGAWAVKVTRDRGQLRGLVAQLQTEQVRLTEELQQAQRTVDDQADELQGLEGRLAELQATLADLEAQRKNLLASNADLTEQVTSLQHDRADLEARLTSLKELRTAIRVVKGQIQQQRWETWLARVRQQEDADVEQLASGNRGYVVQQGFSTLGARASLGTKLQVRVLEPEAQ